MKYAVVVLFNNRTSLGELEYAPVTDALLSGGVFLDEVSFLPYDAPMDVSAAVYRLALDCDGVFMVCDSVLLSAARTALEAAAEKPFEEEYFLETERCLFGALPTGERGAEIVRTQAVPRVDARRKRTYLRVVLRTAMAPHEKLREAVSHAEAAAGGALALHVAEKYGCARIELIYDQLTPKMTADETVRILASELADYLYSLEDESVAQRLVELLTLRRLKVSTAESFTGGGVGRAIVRVPGASAVFYEGVNAYDGAAKTARLGVSEQTLKEKGAVSDETAYQMAAGLLEGGKCDLAIATTGIAGPSSDERNTPVGQCFIAVGTKEQVRVYRFRLAGDRETVTETAIVYALFLAYREIKDTDKTIRRTI